MPGVQKVIVSNVQGGDLGCLGCLLELPVCLVQGGDLGKSS